MSPQIYTKMIELVLLNDYFSLLNENLNIERLLNEHEEDVMLSCDEPYSRTGGEIEHEAARYISSLLPNGYIAIWDRFTEGYRMQKNPTRELPPRIQELRFKVLLGNDSE